MNDTAATLDTVCELLAAEAASAERAYLAAEKARKDADRNASIARSRAESLAEAAEAVRAALATELADTEEGENR
ncbi:hypothetical protein HOT45_gp58 [Gordonia phage Trine]|uniref:Uncharacterized protein n=1 Tax=Gordonia phage Trine TaxID=2201431 RepID=A0A2Z4Q9P7_9CAUD|nr:hypothetical protein HOT45_gp58 [Gordonia phage Trine]AWY06559.1 hypothetical protein PBI_TRINE_58 [Gordonia phage Trine]